MPSAAASTAAARPALVCGNCRRPMQTLALPGHYGRRVDIDQCGPCHLVWFDQTETARLTGQGLLELIGAMAQTQRLPHELLRPDARCARCSSGLKTIHNRTRWGQSLQLECLRGHGAYQSFAQFLQEKGLLRPLSRTDRASLMARDGRIDCVNCGAALGNDDEQCPHCQSVPSLLDIARLARALDPEGVIEPQAIHQQDASQAAMQCAACGVALPLGQALQCGQCSATLAVDRLGEAHRALDGLGPALRAHAAKPAPAVVQRRLDALDADLPRRREWVAGMEADAQQARERRWGRDWNPEELWSEGTNPLRALLIALVIWFVWWFW